MKKKWTCIPPSKGRIRKALLIMKLMTFFILVSVFQVSASAYSQKAFTISLENATLENVMDHIKNNSDYYFLYKNSDIENIKELNIDLTSVDIEEVLTTCLEGTDLSFSLTDNLILIYKKDTFLSLETTQDITVKGIVKDKDGYPLPGVTVLIKGTLNGTTTNGEGAYEIEVPSNGILVFSFIGMKTQEHAVAGKTEIGVVMEDDISQLEEVVIVFNTGYQQLKKDELTGAASVVTTKELKQRVAVTGNFLENLEGKVPGLVYNSQTGELSIRGVSTFDAVKEPLIVVDGFPTEIDLRSINPYDIVSISVLRDAAAASIYGVRASNGVIVIETKKGAEGKPVFTIHATYAVQNKPDFSYLNYADASEFVQLQKEEFIKAKPSYFLFDWGFSKMNQVQEIMFGATQLAVSDPLLTEEQVNEKLLALGSYDNLKEYERLFYQNKITKNLNFDMSGGTDKFTYLLGLNYIDETPVERRSQNRQLSLNMGLNVKLSERINFDFRGKYTNNKDVSGRTPSYSSFFPYERLADENGNPLPVRLEPSRSAFSKVIYEDDNNELMEKGLYDTFYHPYAELASNTNTSKGSSIRFQGRLNIKLTNWLDIDLGGKFESQNILLDQMQLENAYDVKTALNYFAKKDPLTGMAMFVNLPKGNILKKTNQRLTSYTVRSQLNFNHKFGGNDHNITAILGIEGQRTLNKGYTASFFGYDEQSLIHLPVNWGVIRSSRPDFSILGYSSSGFNSNNYLGETESDRRFMSYYGQATYVFKEKYVATGSFRIDRSNLFGADPKFKYKPLWSVGLNWRLGKEEFIQKINWIDNLMLRAATGFNGNVPNSNNGAFLILFSRLNTSLDVPLMYNDILAPENQSLRWETTKNYNLGIDFAIFNNRITGAVDMYIKNTTDIFGSYDADPTSGFNSYEANTASIKNTGFEFVINSLNVKRDKFEWRTQITASFNKNKVVKVKSTEFPNSQYITGSINPVEGYPLGALFSYNYGGLNELGKPFVYDKEGNEKILAFYGSDKVDVTFDDLIYNGTTTPKHVIGINNQFTIGNFDLSFLFMYYGGHVMRVEQPNPRNIGAYSNNPLKGSSNYWKQPGDEENTIIPGFVRGSSLDPGYYQSFAVYAYEYASQFVRKADYIRLRDVIVTYHLKAGFLERIGLYNTQLRFQAQNPFRHTFSGNDIDPDAINRVTGVRRLEIQPFYSFTFSTNF